LPVKVLSRLFPRVMLEKIAAPRTPRRAAGQFFAQPAPLGRHGRVQSHLDTDLIGPKWFV